MLRTNASLFIGACLLVEVFSFHHPSKYVQNAVSLSQHFVMKTTRGLTFGAFMTCATLLGPMHSTAIESLQNVKPNQPLVLQLPNGQVELKDIFFPPYQLKNPILLGSGGGGAVFSYHDDAKDRNIAVKISWVRSASSVERECDVLLTLESGKTRNVEKCIGKERYPPDDRRVMIALEPVVDNSKAVSNIANVDLEYQGYAVKSITRTMVDMLASNVATTDVQPLINKTNGDVLFIDLTEAQVMSTPPSFLDLALASSFCTEMAALITPSEDNVNSSSSMATLSNIASTTLLHELKELRGRDIPEEIYGILQSQDIFNSNPDTAAYIESKISP